jgi:hypothetical protein
MSFELSNPLHILYITTVIALAFFLIRLGAGYLVGNGGLADQIGNAILNIYP